MNLLNILKDKASGLLQGASDKVSEATGIDPSLGGIPDQVTESADGPGETTQGLADTAGDQVAAANNSPARSRTLPRRPAHQLWPSDFHRRRTGG